MQLMFPASAGDVSAADIARLPQDKVALIKQQCAHWGNQGKFEMQRYCEDEEYEALQELINRGSLKPNGDRL
ncbi:hypothetical protein [Bradyrhizobium sp. UFLA05-112]